MSTEATTRRFIHINPGETWELWLRGERVLINSEIIKGRKPAIGVVAPPDAMIRLLTAAPRKA